MNRVSSPSAAPMRPSQPATAAVCSDSPGPRVSTLSVSKACSRRPASPGIVVVGLGIISST